MVTNNENQGLNPVDQPEWIRFSHKINCDRFGETVRDWGENDWYDNWYDDDDGFKREDSNSFSPSGSSIKTSEIFTCKRI